MPQQLRSLAAAGSTNPPTRQKTVSIPPPLPDETDVCSGIEDEEFKKFCLENFDTDKDGKISRREAELVKTIECPGWEVNILSFKGIEYFKNLETFSCPRNEDVTAIDLHYNTKITVIPDDAFDQCYKMKDFVFPPNTRSIGNFAFSEWCMTEFTIPEGVETIGECAIGFCGKLEEITIPGSITSFADGALQCCDNLKAIHSKFASEDKRCLIIDGRLVGFAPAGLAAYTIPEGVKSIGGTFYLFDELKELTIPESVGSIGHAAFAQCGLEQINIKAMTPPAMEGDIFHINDGSYGYIPAINVPKAAVDAYNAAEGWKEYAEYIRGMQL